MFLISLLTPQNQDDKIATVCLNSLSCIGADWVLTYISRSWQTFSVSFASLCNLILFRIRLIVTMSAGSWISAEMWKRTLLTLSQGALFEAGPNSSKKQNCNPRKDGLTALSKMLLPFSIRLLYWASVGSMCCSYHMKGFRSCIVFSNIDCQAKTTLKPCRAGLPQSLCKAPLFWIQGTYVVVLIMMQRIADKRLI